MSILDIFRQSDVFLPPLIAGIALTAVCSLLSVLVVQKRWAFIGQGISHAGFGGVGIAACLALHPTSITYDVVVFAFCLLTGLTIGALTRSRKVMVDTAIGILLVATMGAGILLDQARFQWDGLPWFEAITAGRPLTPTSWHSVLFGSILSVQLDDMWIAIIVSLIVVIAITLMMKEVVFFSFDEISSQVFGVRSGFLHYFLLCVLAMMIVMSMKLAGLILVNALLVVPGATAGLLSRKLGWVLVISLAVGEIGFIAGYFAGFQVMDGSLPVGPFIVLFMTIQFGLAFVWSRASRKYSSHTE